MNKYICVLSSLLCVFIFSLHAQEKSTKPYFVKGDNYKGFVFPKDFLFHGYHKEPDGYTLSFDEINLAEKILSENIKKYKRMTFRKRKHKNYLGSGESFVQLIENGIQNFHKKDINGYIRQYIGYIKNGHIIVSISLYKETTYNNTYDMRELSTDLFTTFDGGDNVFYFAVDLNKSDIVFFAQPGYNW